MKKVFTGILVGLMLCMALCMTGCSAEFAKNDYDNNAKIASSDRVIKGGYVTSTVNNTYTLKSSSFNGRETVWSQSFNGSTSLKISIDLSISSGYIKIVHVDSNGNVTVLAECTQDGTLEKSNTKTVSMTSGTNKIKLVGYDCKSVKLKLVFA